MIKEQIEKAAKNVSIYCHCAGPTCSGCEETSERLFTAGADFVLERAKILENALEQVARNLRGAIELNPGDNKLAFVCSKVELDCEKSLKEYRGE